MVIRIVVICITSGSVTAMGPRVRPVAIKARQGEAPVKLFPFLRCVIVGRTHYSQLISTRSWVLRPYAGYKIIIFTGVLARTILCVSAFGLCPALFYVIRRIWCLSGTRLGL